MSKRSYEMGRLRYQLHRDMKWKIRTMTYLSP